MNYIFFTVQPSHFRIRKSININKKLLTCLSLEDLKEQNKNFYLNFYSVKKWFPNQVKFIKEHLSICITKTACH